MSAPFAQAGMADRTDMLCANTCTEQRAARRSNICPSGAEYVLGLILRVNVVVVRPIHVVDAARMIVRIDLLQLLHEPDRLRKTVVLVGRLIIKVHLLTKRHDFNPWHVVNNFNE